MCRFLLVKYNQSQSVITLLEQFAKKCKTDLSLEDDWQGDGWGFTYLDTHDSWQTHKSLRPIWDDYNSRKYPRSKIFMIHARSASYNKSLDDVTVNQPYANSKYAFVFNGNLAGVKIKRRIPGKIGAQKLWFLVREFLEKDEPDVALKEFGDYLLPKISKLHAMNIGVSDKQDIYAINHFAPNDVKPEYHKLYRYSDDGVKLISSMVLDV